MGQFSGVGAEGGQKGKLYPFGHLTLFSLETEVI